MDFKVILWICPFISPHSEAFRELNSRRLLLMDNDGKKGTSWGDLRKLIPHILVSGLSGNAFICPDLIGGGEISSFPGAKENLDQDLIVRSRAGFNVIV